MDDTRDVIEPEQLEALRASLDEDQREALDCYLAEVDDHYEQRLLKLQERREELTWGAERTTGVLTDIKYWFLNVLVHRQPMTDPREILRKVEDVLGA